METHRSIVIVPSRTIDKFHEPAAETQAYEQRLLCLLLMLRDPDLQVVYVTSLPVAEPIVDYYLALLGPELAAEARERLTMISADDASVRPLSAKLLERPALLSRIRWAIDDLERCHLVPYVSTELELAVGDALGIPVHGADPALAYFGTKSGSRELFARAGVPHPLGVEQITGRADAVAAIARLRAERPGAAAGRRQARRRRLRRGQRDRRSRRSPPARRARRDAPDRRRFDAMELEATGVPRGGLPRAALLRRRRRGAHRRNRAAQPERAARADPGRRDEDRLDPRPDPSGQRFLGCRFPADRRTRGRSPTALAGSSPGASRPGRAAVRDRLRRRARRQWRPAARMRSRSTCARRHDAPAAALQPHSGGAYDADAAIFRPPAASRATRRDRPSRVAGLRELGHGDLLRLAALPASGGRRLRRRLPHVARRRSSGRVGLTAIGSHRSGCSKPLRTRAGTAARRRRRVRGGRRSTTLWTLSVNILKRPENYRKFRCVNTFVTLQEAVPNAWRTLCVATAASSSPHSSPRALAAPSTAFADCPDADITPAAGNLDQVRAAFLCLHNEVRADRGLPKLKENARLRKAAAKHSADMVDGRLLQPHRAGRR